MIKKFKNFELSTESKLTFKGDVIVTDPCYFIPDNLWSELCDSWWDDNKPNEFTDKGTITFNSGTKVLYSVTAYGDGSYGVSNANGESVHYRQTGVDAGMIAIVSVEDAKKLNSEFKENDPFFPRINNFDGEVYADGEGNFKGDITVITEDEPDEDDDYYDDDNY